MFKIPDWDDYSTTISTTNGKKTKKNNIAKLEKLPSQKKNVDIQDKNVTSNVKKNKSLLSNLSIKSSKKIQKSQSNILNGITIVEDTKIKGKLRKLRNVDDKNYKSKKHEFKIISNVSEPISKKKKNSNVYCIHENVRESNSISEKKTTDRISNTKNQVDSKNQYNNENNLEESNLEVMQNLNKKSKKRKNNKISTERESEGNVEALDSDLFDEVLINAKKKKITEAIENDDQEELLFAESKQELNKTNNKKSIKIFNNDSTKINGDDKIDVPDMDQNWTKINGYNKNDRKKAKLQKILEMQSNRRHINISGNNLRTRMLERLKAAQFRFLNEKLYTSSGNEAQKLFQSDPSAFHTYHEGYQQQLKKWPVNPLDVIVKQIKKMPKSHSIADMGCGEAALSIRIPHKVKSFDLIATSPGVEACDMAHTPLLAASMDVAVYCLALMGTDLTQYLVEANRILKIGGHLLIAEVESRFEKVEDFTKEVERLGFKLKKLDKSNTVFFFMEFIKIRDPPVKKSKLPVLTLKPCLYKKR